MTTWISVTKQLITFGNFQGKQEQKHKNISEIQLQQKTKRQQYFTIQRHIQQNRDLSKEATLQY